MTDKKSVISIAIVILIGVLFQVIFCFADMRDTPYRAAVEFVKAFHQLDETIMKKRLCEAFSGVDEIDVVDQFIHKVKKEATQRGYDVSYMRSFVFNIKATPLSQEPDMVVVRLTGKKIRCINPVFAYIARVFSLAEISSVDETLTLTNEQGCWKVCSPVAGLNS